MNLLTAILALVLWVAYPEIPATFTFIPSILLYLRLLPGTDERYSIEDVGHHE